MPPGSRGICGKGIIKMKSCQPNNAHLIEAPCKVTKDSQASEDNGNGENLKQEGNGLLNTTRIKWEFSRYTCN